MPRDYIHADIEKKWQDYWEKNKTFRVVEDAKFPSPSGSTVWTCPLSVGAGLHVGHPEGYTASDIVCRYLA